MKKAAFVEVVGGAFVAVETIGTIEVSETERDGFAVLLSTTLGHTYCYALRDDEDAAHRVSLDL